MIRLLAFLVPLTVAHAAEPHRSFYDLPSSNGFGAAVLDLQQARVHHLRDHLFATEEPQWTAEGEELWSGGQPQVVWTRDLLFDAYFGLRVGGDAFWLTDLPVDLDASGWGSPDGGVGGGTNLVAMVQNGPGFVATTWAWAPWGLERAALAMVLEVENTGADPLIGLSAYSLHNLHLGEGRPGPDQETGAQNETVILGDVIEERGFAGVVALHPLVDPTLRTSWHPAAGVQNPYDRVATGDGGLASLTGEQGTHDDQVTYLQWELGDLPPGGTARVGLVLAHHPDPFAFDALVPELETWVDDPLAVLDRERATWAEFQTRVSPPAGLDPGEEQLYRHAAAVLRMAQVRESGAWLREWLTADGDPRRSMFSDALPAQVEHRAQGAILASLPPGRWTYAWPRDAAYAIAGLSRAGLHAEAAEGLRFLLTAVSDRYRGYDELAGWPIEPYQVSLCRHHGFGIEESDTLGDGDFNFEFDGAGLLLWALGEYVDASGDTAFVDAHWAVIRDAVAGFLVPLVDDGLILADSSIWEHHWLGKERQWAYTSITAMRGLSEAAELADARGDARGAEFRAAAEALRAGVLTRLRDGDGVVAQTLEELPAGGYYDGAVFEAVGLGLLDPAQASAPATVAALVANLQTADGPGFSRNDDAWDAHDLSPWGSGYDSDEWVMIDLRGSVAARAVGEVGLADDLLDWVTAQSLANYGAIGETFDPVTGDYTNNAPMVGFGPGAWILAVHAREGDAVEPACGAWLEDEEAPGGDDDDATVDDDDATADDDDATGGPADDDDSTPVGTTYDGCACDAGASAAPLLPLVLGLRRRRRPR